MLHDGPFIELATPLTTRRPLKRRLNEESASSPIKGPKSVSSFEAAKRLFHRSAQVRVVGRTAERAMIDRFWHAAVGDGAKVLYICGNPGTGKTALIEEMLPELIDSHNLVKVNCMMQNDPRDTLREIAIQLKLNLKKNVMWDDVYKSLEGHFSKCRDTTTILVLDEIDQIAVKDHSLLESIFKWPYMDQAKLIIIGIANALDLSIRYFSTPPSEVEILNFAPYSVEDIARILIARLELANAQSSENRASLISPMAIEICARKVSSVTDLRKALEIMREGLTIAEQAAASTVEIEHVTQAMERIFGSTVRTTSRNAQLISELNLHQKLLMATLYRLLKDSPTLKPTVQTLLERYSAAVRVHRIIDAVGRSEFNDLVANTESMGVIALVAAGKKSKNSGPASPDTKVILSLPLDDVRVGLSDNPVLAQML